MVKSSLTTLVGWLCCLTLMSLTARALQPHLLESTVLHNVTDCPDLSLEPLTQNVSNHILNQLSKNFSSILNLGMDASYGARSCREILSKRPNHPSGYYWVFNASKSAVQVYCDLSRVLNGTRGWMRTTYLNMSDSSQLCPSNWTLYTASGKRLCGKANTGCYSVYYPTHGLNYTKVCGWVRGYQFGSPDGFYRHGCPGSCTIDNPYVDGVSITYCSGPRRHIWTYTSGHSGNRCPCSTQADSTSVPPNFVGENHYCESSSFSNYTLDPLWDGMQCPGSDAPCCTNPDLPWFYRTFPAPVTGDLEVRICCDQSIGDEDVRLENLELYVV